MPSSTSQNTFITPISIRNEAITSLTRSTKASSRVLWVLSFCTNFLRIFLDFLEPHIHSRGLAPVSWAFHLRYKSILGRWLRIQSHVIDMETGYVVKWEPREQF